MEGGGGWRGKTISHRKIFATADMDLFFVVTVSEKLGLLGFTCLGNVLFYHFFFNSTDETSLSSPRSSSGLCVRLRLVSPITCVSSLSRILFEGWSLTSGRVN